MLDRMGLHVRAALFASIRQFFTSRGFLEVDTPLRQPHYIPERNIIHITAEDQYLQASPELCMKRILAAGCEKIFQICRCFRKGERGRNHLEEFTMLEWYRRDADYLQLMEDCEDLLADLAERMAVVLADIVPGGSHRAFPGMDVNRPWPCLSVEDAFRLYSPIPLDRCLVDDCFEAMLVEYVEPHLGVRTPVFLCDYPAEMASLAKKKRENPNVAERFELYVQGLELANGFSELTDANEQRARFRHEIDLITKAGRGQVVMPERFLDDLERLQDAAGIALGCDRLFMLLVGSKEISKAVTFAPEDL